MEYVQNISLLAWAIDSYSKLGHLAKPAVVFYARIKFFQKALQLRRADDRQTPTATDVIESHMLIHVYS